MLIKVSLKETYSTVPSPDKSQRPSAKAVLSLWFKLPDIHQTKVLFIKDKLPAGFIFLHVATATSLNMSRPSNQDNKPISIAYPQLLFSRLLFPIPATCFVRRNGLI
jgi:hypothetical protein